MVAFGRNCWTSVVPRILISCFGLSLVGMVVAEPVGLPRVGHSWIRHTAILRADDIEGLDDLLAQHCGPEPCDHALPPVDFDTQTLVAFYLGPQPDGGVGVRIKKVLAGDRAIRLQVEVSKAAGGCEVIQIGTYPYHWVLVEKLPRWRLFEYELTIREHDC